MPLHTGCTLDLLPTLKSTCRSKSDPDEAAVVARQVAQERRLRFVQINVYRLAEVQPLVRQSLQRVSRGGLASAEGRGDVAHGRLSCEEGRSRNSK